jgi:hypothetical protein
MTTHTTCYVKKGILSRWLIHSAELEARAWTGTRWAPCSPGGLATGQYQISSFRTQQEAERAATAAGLTLIDPKPADEPWVWHPNDP